MKKVIDLTGLRSGRLVAIRYVKGDRHERGKWLCQCDCGNTTLALAGMLRTQKIKSCGACANKRLATGSSAYVHGHAQKGKTSPTYSTWQGMVARCRNPKRREYKHYGGRGIEVCEQWMNFENFLADMGERPPGTTIERIDNDGNYEPGNCRWATQKEQNNNRRNNHLITFNGKTLTMQQWARSLRISSANLFQRIKRWGKQRAMTTAGKVRERGLFTFRGTTLNLLQWAQRLKVTEDCLYKRLYVYDWTLERTLSTKSLARKKGERALRWKKTKSAR